MITKAYKKTEKLLPGEHASFRFFVDQFSSKEEAANAIGIKRSTILRIYELGRGFEVNILLIRSKITSVIGEPVAKKIVEGVLTEFGITIQDLTTKNSRKQELWLVVPKQATCYLMGKYNCKGNGGIASFLGYPLESKNVVSEYIDAIAREITVNMVLREKISNIENTLKN